MTLSRSRRIATGIAAGVIVLCAALIGASLRDDSSGVSVASEARVAIPIPELEDIEPDEPEDAAVATGDDDATEDSPVEDTEDPESTTDPVQVIDEDDLPAEGATDGNDADDVDASADDTDDGTSETDDGTAADDEAADAGDAASDADSTDSEPAGDVVDDATNDGAPDNATDDAATNDGTSSSTPPPAPTATPAAPPLANDGLGTGGGVTNAECGLDRLVIYAGAPVGGVAGRLRSALANAGFGAGCPTPVVVLAANCPLQFSGVLPAGTSYDPQRSYVASSASVDRNAMTEILGSVGYTGSGIDILPFGFAQADKPGERWMAVFVPPSFTGWEGLAGRAGLSAAPQSLCGPTGRVGG